MSRVRTLAAARVARGTGRFGGLSVVGVALLACAFVAPTARAQVDDFNDGNDQGWTQYAPLRDLGVAAATYSFPAGAYQIASAASPAPNIVGPARAGSIRDDATYSDFQTAVDVLNWGGSSNLAIGLLARTRREAAPGTLDGYAFTYSTGGTTPGINLSVVTDERANDVVTPVPVTLVNGLSYRFVFTGRGPQLTGTVYALSDPATPLATITGTDVAYGSGVNGLVVFDNTNTSPVSGTFDNYFAAVPEPASAGLVLLGLAGALARRRTR